MTSSAADQSQHDLRVDYIELPAVDIARAKDFYSSVFGWKMTDWGPDYASFDDGRLNGGLRKVDSSNPPTQGGPLIVIYAVDLEKIQSRIRAAGGVIVKDIFAFPGGRRFHFKDAAGNELAVWSDKSAG